MKLTFKAKTHSTKKLKTYNHNGSKRKNFHLNAEQNICIIEFVQTNRSKSALYVYRSLSTLLLNLVFCLLYTNTQIQIVYAMLWHTMRILKFVLPFFSPKQIYFPFRCCLCALTARPEKTSNIFYSKLLLFICYFVVILWLCDTILLFILPLLIYLLLFCQSSATLSEQIYVFQWNLFFSIPFQAIHMCSFERVFLSLPRICKRKYYDV